MEDQEDYTSFSNDIDMKHPTAILILGLFLVSIVLNVVQHGTIKKLIYKIQRLEAGEFKGLFDKPFLPPIPKQKDLRDKDDRPIII